MEHGPIQLLAFAFDDVSKLQGQLKRELNALRGHGLITILDLLFIKKALDGTVETIEASDLTDYAGSNLGALLARLLGLHANADDPATLGQLLGATLAPSNGAGLGLDEVRQLAAGVPPGQAVALLMVEHSWAMGFATAVREADGRMVAQGFLTRDALLAVGQELNAIVEAEVTLKRSAAIKGAAMLDTLTTLAVADELQQAALEEAMHTVVGVEAFRATVAAEAVRSLVVAGLLTEADALDAINVLVDAELITSSAVATAASAAEVALAELSQEW